MPRPSLAVATAIVTIAVGAGCSRDASRDAAPTEGSSTNASADTSASSDASVLAGPLAPLTADEICERLPGETLGEQLGIEVVESEASSGDETPQCAYTYRTADGSSNNVTVAAMRPEDLGGRDTAAEAYDHTLQVNRQLAGERDEMAVDAGERAVLLSGAATLQVGIIATDGGHVMTVLVADGEIPSVDVQALMTEVGDTFAD